MKKLVALSLVSFFGMNLCHADELKITYKNLISYSIGEYIDCNPKGYAEHYGFDTTIALNDGRSFVARTCMDGPIGFRSARASMLKNLARILNNETSFEKNSSQIVCFKTIGIMDTSSKVITFDNRLVKCP